MTEPQNLNRPEWDVELGDAPFRVRVMRVGDRAGGQELGASLYEIASGGAVSPYHAHHGNEELLLVLSGTPRLRTPDGTRELEAGAVVAFPRGTAGAHRITNPEGATEAARVLLVSTTRFPDVVEYPDNGTVLAITGPQEGKAFPAGSDIAFVESRRRGMQAAAEHESESAE